MSNRQPADLESLADLCTPWCIHVVTTLRIAEHIDAGTTRIDDLARASDCDAYALHRVMTWLATKGVFDEPRPGVFALNDCSRGLLSPMAHVTMDLDGIGGRMANAWGTLPTYVRTGDASGYRQRFGRSFWEDLDADAKLAASFDDLIGAVGHGTPSAQIELAGGWDNVRHVVDVGGGTGLMLAAILRARPDVRGTLVELPRAARGAAETFRDAGVLDRATVAAQSFFDPLPAGADLYLLRGVINDWPDREAIAILRRCADAARPSGRVVVMKGLCEEDAPRPIAIEMVLAGGKTRSVPEFRAIARDAGLDVVSIARQPTGYFVAEMLPS